MNYFEQLSQVSDPYSATRIKMENPKLYKDLCALKDKDTNVVLLSALILEGIYPKRTNKCPICGKEYHYTINCNTKKLKRACSNSCELKIRHQDPQYIQNIVSKTIVTKTTPNEEGITIAQMSSRKAAETMKKIYTSKDRGEQISKGHLKSRKIKIRAITQKIDRIVNKYGLFKFIRKFYCILYSDHSLYRFNRFCNIFSDKSLYNITSGDIIQMWIQMTKKSHIINCEFCGKEFSQIVSIVGTTVEKSNSKFCCPECRISFIYTDERRAMLSERKLVYNTNNPKAKEIASERSKAMWKQRDGKLWSQIMLNTMGINGIQERTEKATETKLRKGIISHVRSLDKERLLYVKYKNKVLSYTKSQALLLDNYDKNIIGKDQYHVDHIFPISKGYLYKIPAELIGSQQNLQILWCRMNWEKGNDIVEIPENILYYIKNNCPEILEDL